MRSPILRAGLLATTIAACAGSIGPSTSGTGGVAAGGTGGGGGTDGSICGMLVNQYMSALQDGAGRCQVGASGQCSHLVPSELALNDCFIATYVNDVSMLGPILQAWQSDGCAKLANCGPLTPQFPPGNQCLGVPGSTGYCGYTDRGGTTGTGGFGGSGGGGGGPTGGIGGSGGAGGIGGAQGTGGVSGSGGSPVDGAIGAGNTSSSARNCTASVAAHRERDLACPAGEMRHLGPGVRVSVDGSVGFAAFLAGGRGPPLATLVGHAIDRSGVDCLGCRDRRM